MTGDLGTHICVCMGELYCHNLVKEKLHIIYNCFTFHGAEHLSSIHVYSLITGALRLLQILNHHLLVVEENKKNWLSRKATQEVSPHALCSRSPQGTWHSEGRIPTGTGQACKPSKSLQASERHT